MLEYSAIDGVGVTVSSETLSNIVSDLLPPGDYPLFFGENNELYGFCRIPNKKNNNNIGVIFCYPIGEDYIFQHRFFRLLSDSIVQQGVPVFKFDYLGTGDSMGDSNDWSMETWSKNVISAHYEIIKITGVEKVNVVAHGLGAIIAAKAIEQKIVFEKCVFWDPVRSGSNYFSGMRTDHFNRIESQKKIYPFPGDGNLMIDQDEINGFIYKQELQSAISASNLADFNLESCSRVEILYSKKISKFISVYGQIQEKRRMINAITSSVCGGI